MSRLPKWLEKDDSIKKKSQKHEKKMAKKIGGRRRAGSGNCSFWPGDIVKGKYLIEQKSAITQKEIKVREKMLKKIFREAYRVNKMPAMVLEFHNYILIGKVFKK